MYMYDLILESQLRTQQHCNGWSSDKELCKVLQKAVFYFDTQLLWNQFPVNHVACLHHKCVGQLLS